MITVSDTEWKRMMAANEKHLKMAENMKKNLTVATGMLDKIQKELMDSNIFTKGDMYAAWMAGFKFVGERKTLWVPDVEADKFVKDYRTEDYDSKNQHTTGTENRSEHS